MTPKWLQRLQKNRKINEQEELIKAFKRPENEPRRRPAMKFSSNRTRNIGSR